MSKFTVIASLLVGSMAPMVHGQVQCSTANLRGLYSFVASGTLGGQPFATAGQAMYEGNGNVSGLIQISLNGSVTPLLKWTGTYTIDPETCVVNKEVLIPGIGKVHFVVTAAGGFDELRFIATDPGATISGTAKRQVGPWGSF